MSLVVTPASVNDMLQCGSLSVFPNTGDKDKQARPERRQEWGVWGWWTVGKMGKMGKMGKWEKMKEIGSGKKVAKNGRNYVCLGATEMLYVQRVVVVLLFCFVLFFPIFTDFYRFLPIFSRYFPGIFFVGRFFFPFFLIFFNFQISKFPFKLPNLQSSTTQNCLIFFSPKNQPSLAYPKRPLSESGTQNKHKRPKYAQNEQVAFFSPFFPTQKT